MSLKTIGPLLREENYLIFLYSFLGRAQRGAVSHSVLGTSIKFDIALPVWNRRDDHLFLFFLSLPTNETCTVEIVFNLSKYATNIISRYIWYSKLFWKGHKNLKKYPTCFDTTEWKQLFCQKMWEIFSNFVAFSQCLNFKGIKTCEKRSFTHLIRSCTQKLKLDSGL